jgi:hypothetical protein
VKSGAVWKLNVRDGKWTDITPDKRPNRPGSGYMA